MAPHIFVETNWLFAYAAPAHHQVPAAAELLDRARRGEFTVHMPNICLGEARQAILTKCQPGHEANALRRFLTWGLPAGHVTEADAATARVILSRAINLLLRDRQRPATLGQARERQATTQRSFRSSPRLGVRRLYTHRATATARF